PSGAFDTWSYTYPVGNTTPHLVTVIDPLNNVRKVTYQGYLGIGNTVWKVGSVLRDERFDGCCTSLLAVDNTYDFKIVSNSADPEANNYDTMKIPVQLQATKTYSQTNQQAVTSY